MRLTFANRQFVLDQGPRDVLPDSIKGNPNWSKRAIGEYVTSSVREAARLREYADNTAEKILKKAFVKFYPPPARLPLFLDAHQKEGVAWALSRSASYLAHAPGAGKTWQAVVAGALASGRGGVLLVVPPSLTVNWERETHKIVGRLARAPNLDPAFYWPSVSIIPESAARTSADFDADFVICPDSMLHKPWVLTELLDRHWRLIAADEASRFKDHTTVRAGVFYRIAKRAKHVVLLDGSPISKRPIEIWAPTFALSPESIDFMSRDEFGQRYCGPELNERGLWEYKHSSNEEELRSRLQKSFMHVVPESRLGHAKREREMIFMTEDVRSAAHKTWERKHLSSISFDDIDEDMCQGDIARFRRELGERKVKWVAKYVRDRIREMDEQVIVFAWHREVVHALARELGRFKPGVVMGGVPNKAREKIFADFQARRLNPIIGNIAAMGRGNNLQEGDRIIFAEWSWSDQLNLQCEKRASRRGRDSTKSVQSDYIVMPDSMDEIVLRSVFAGARNFKRIIGD